MRWHCAPLLCFLLLLAAGTQAQPGFPELTGRVVDRADMLSPATERALTEKLAGHERASGNQLVVATLPDLQGYSIEDYGYQLAREWGIGQKGEDNGALLIVSKEERALRIEVGYGLEGQLTDAVSSQIIHQILTPAFKAGEFDRGVTEAVDAMITVLGGGVLPQKARGGGDSRSHPLGGLLILLVFLLMRGGRGGLLGGLMVGSMLGGRVGRGGGGFGGGFSGGGGGFGGGGASGGW